MLFSDALHASCERNPSNRGSGLWQIPIHDSSSSMHPISATVLNGNKMTVQYTRGRPSFAERFIGAFKSMLVRRIEARSTMDRTGLSYIGYV